MSNNTWRKSSYSGNEPTCVELAPLSDAIGVRDSKNPHAGHLTLNSSAFAALVRSIKNG